MARFYADENFHLPVVEALRQLGHDVLTALEAGQANQGISDADVLAFAVENERAVLTLNRKDFRNLHNAAPEHFGVVICTVDPDHARQAQRIHDAVTARESVEGQLIRVNRPSN